MNELVGILIAVVIGLFICGTLVICLSLSIIRSLSDTIADNNAMFESSTRLAHDKVLIYADQQLERMRIEAGGNAEPEKPLGSAGVPPPFKLNVERPAEPGPDIATEFNQPLPNIVGD